MPDDDGVTMKRRVLLVAAATAVAALAGAVVLLRQSQGPLVMTPYFRFADTALRSKVPEERDGPALVNPVRARIGPSDLSVATLLDETRYVLQAPTHETLIYTEEATVKSDGTVSFLPELPGVLRGAERLVLVPQLRIGTAWTKLRRFEATPERDGNISKVRVALTTAEAPGAKVGIHVEGFAIPRNHSASHRTATVRIPRGAYLELGIGILDPAWEQGAVEFEVKACRANACDLVFQEILDPTSAATRGWQDRRVSLDSLAGTDRMFEFTTRLTNADPHAFSFPLWGNPTVYAPAHRASEAANVILLSIDTLRANHLTTYGYQHDTAPFINETFGKGGTVFDHCVAAATTTPPSHMTMFTSVQPCVHGLRTGFEVLPDWLITLAEQLRADGVETGAVTEDGWLGISHGFGRGFNSYVENTSPNIMEPEGQVDVTFGKAKEWLASKADKRFFLFLHTFQVHDPYRPPPSYESFFGTHDGQPVTATSPRPVRDLVNYDREIRYTDDELRKLFAAIEANGLGENTIFILTSDHGEEFFEHGLWGHGADLYEEATHVPLMFWGPGRIPADKRVRRSVGTIDFMPTILDIVGVPKPAQVQGASLTDLLRNGRADASGVDRPLFSEAWAETAIGANYELAEFARPAYLLQIGMQKLMQYRRRGGFEYEYYDLTKDAGERHNADDPTAGHIAIMHERLAKYENDCIATAVTLSTQSRSTRATTPKAMQLSPSEEEKLRALGYLN